MVRKNSLLPFGVDDIGFGYAADLAVLETDFYPPRMECSRGQIVSGTPGYDLHTGKVVSDNFEEQVRQSFRNIKTILEEAGSLEESQFTPFADSSPGSLSRPGWPGN